MPVDVHLASPLEDGAMSVLRDRLDAGVALTIGPELPDPAQFEVLVTGTPSVEDLTASERLHSLVIPYAGVPGRTRKALMERPEIRVYNLHHNAGPTAEMAVSLLLAAAKTITLYDAAMRRHEWGRLDPPGPSVVLEGKRAVVLGYGAIGRRVGQALSTLGMRVTAVRRSVPAMDDDGEVALPAGAEKVASVADLDETLPAADALVVTVPLTDETKRMLDARRLALLPRGAVLVNVGRGPVIDETALYEALRSRHIYAAGIDVWYQYPKDRAEGGVGEPSQHPFHELDNVVMSPHRAGWSDNTELLRAESLAETLNCFAAGETPPHPVDLERGY